MNIPAPFSQNQMRFFWNCFDHWFNVAEGGKRGGKNVLITMAYCTILEKHPSRIHLIAGVSTATARLNILDCDGFGLKTILRAAAVRAPTRTAIACTLRPQPVKRWCLCLAAAKPVTKS